MNTYASNTKLIMFFLKGTKRYFVLSACFALLVSFLDMINPRIISFAVDSVIGNKETSLPGFLAGIIRSCGGIGHLRNNLWIVALAVALTGIAAALCRLCFRSCNARGAQRFVKRIRDVLFEHIMYLPYAWLGENSTGDIIQRCTSDVQTIKRFISEQMTALVRTIILLILTFFFMSQISIPITIANGVFIPVIISYSLFFHRRIGDSFEKADVEEGKLSTIAQENLTGVRVVRAFGREIYEKDRFEKQNEIYTGYWIHLIKVLSVFWSSGDLINGLQMMTVLYLGTRLCLQDRLSVGGFIALIAYTVMLTWPVRALGRVISEMSKAGISIDRLRYIMNAAVEQDRPEPAAMPSGGDIVFDHVSFSYTDKTDDVLKDISFTIKEGSTMGILGGTGSGKSTLMYLLEHLYELGEGQGHIYIGGTDIASVRREELRRHIGIVLQEPYLFSRTLAGNIAITMDETDMEAVREASRTASIDEAIESFTAGYETQVGERGVTLSGGQKQRTAIAQLLIRKTPVMIFDDSLSAVDAETDAKIRAALKKECEGATVILISHRITTLMHADQIIVLDKGKIREQGTHEQLLAKNGLYRKIYDIQCDDSSLWQDLVLSEDAASGRSQPLMKEDI